MHGYLEVGREITDEIQNANRMASMDPTGEIDVEKSGCKSCCKIDTWHPNCVVTMATGGYRKYRNSYSKPKTRAIDGGPWRSL